MIVQKGKDIVRAVASVLGDDERKFLLGTEEPTSYDVDVYAFMSDMVYSPWAGKVDWVMEVKKECPNLVKYLERMKGILYPPPTQ